MEDEKIMWFYKMGMISSLKAIGITNEEMIEVYRRLYTHDAAMYYCPYVPKFLS